MKNYPLRPKVGNVVICIEDCSADEDWGMSGIVLQGRRDLIKGEEYVISSLPWGYDENVPKNNDKKIWSKQDFPEVRWGWHRVYLKGLANSVYLFNFEPKQ